MSSKITLTSLLAIGAAHAFAFTAMADEPKQATQTTKIGDIKGESQRGIKFDGVEGEAKDREPTPINAGCEPYPACARNKEAMEKEIAAPMNSDGFVPVAGAALAKGSGGEDRLTENVTLQADGRSKGIIGKPSNVPTSANPVGDAVEADLDAPRPQGGNDPIPGIDIIIKRPCAPNCETIAAPNLDDAVAPTASDERLGLANGRPMQKRGIASGPNGMVPEVEEDAAEQIGGDDPIPGIDIIIKKAPKDR